MFSVGPAPSTLYSTMIDSLASIPSSVGTKLMITLVALIRGVLG